MFALCVMHSYVLNSTAYQPLQHAPPSPFPPHPLLVHSSPALTGGQYYQAAYHDGNNGEEISYIHKTEVSVHHYSFAVNQLSNCQIKHTTFTGMKRDVLMWQDNRKDGMNLHKSCCNMHSKTCIVQIHYGCYVKAC